MKKVVLSALAMTFISSSAMADILSITRQHNPTTDQYRINFYESYGADGVRGGGDDTVRRVTGTPGQSFAAVLHGAINTVGSASVQTRRVAETNNAGERINAEGQTEAQWVAAGNTAETFVANTVAVQETTTEAFNRGYTAGGDDGNAAIVASFNRVSDATTGDIVTVQEISLKLQQVQSARNSFAGDTGNLIAAIRSAGAAAGLNVSRVNSVASARIIAERLGAMAGSASFTYDSEAIARGATGSAYDLRDREAAKDVVTGRDNVVDPELLGLIAEGATHVIDGATYAWTGRNWVEAGVQAPRVLDGAAAELANAANLLIDSSLHGVIERALEAEYDRGFDDGYDLGYNHGYADGFADGRATQ